MNQPLINHELTIMGHDDESTRNQPSINCDIREIQTDIFCFDFSPLFVETDILPGKKVKRTTLPIPLPICSPRNAVILAQEPRM